MRATLRQAVLQACCALVFAAVPAAADPPVGAAGAAAVLGATGLYADFASRRIDPRNLAYSPQYPLWSDGAAKRRWIRLPLGGRVDAADPDQWAFPTGTKVWKEFSFNGRPVETRLIERLPNGDWRFSSYVWNADLTDATLAPADGLRGVAEIEPGIQHDIPSVLDCQACHFTDRVELLGFSALQLSSDRDPGDPHAAPTSPGMVDLATIVERELIQSYPRTWVKKPPRIDGRNPTERSSLGYLHANCGNCHNRSSSLESLGLILRHSVAPGAAGEPGLFTTMDRVGTYRIPGVAPGESYLIRPGDPAHSAVFTRMDTRNPFHQMPPLGTKIVDSQAAEMIRRWITEMPAQSDGGKR